MEAELQEIETRLKEKNQENNLLDFKLRQFVRNNEQQSGRAGYIKPHSGMH